MLFAWQQIRAGRGLLQLGRPLIVSWCKLLAGIRETPMGNIQIPNSKLKQKELNLSFALLGRNLYVAKQLLKSNMKKYFWPTLITLVSFWSAAACRADGPYHLIKEIPVGGDGGWDYVSVDSEGRVLYVSHGT